LKLDKTKPVDTLNPLAEPVPVSPEYVEEEVIDEITVPIMKFENTVKCEVLMVAGKTEQGPISQAAAESSSVGITAAETAGQFPITQGAADLSSSPQMSAAEIPKEAVESSPKKPTKRRRLHRKNPRETIIPQQPASSESQSTSADINPEVQGQKQQSSKEGTAGTTKSVAQDEGAADIESEESILSKSSEENVKWLSSSNIVIIPHLAATAMGNESKKMTSYLMGKLFSFIQ
jgi:hypothetical protein